jgi:hypothetical protein
MKMDGPVVLVISGPLAGYEAMFRAYLSRSGYAPRSVRDLVGVMARASCWLEGRGLTARACPVDHGTGSRSQMRIAATSTLPR